MGAGTPLLHGAAIVVAEAGADIADPRGDDAADASGADELVEQHVGDGADQREVPAPLADQLVTGGERDGRLERGAHADRGAVGDEAGDGLLHRHQLASSHPRILHVGGGRR